MTQIKEKEQPKETQKETKYKVILKTSGSEYEEDGKTIVSALNKMGLTWDMIKGKGVIDIVKGEESIQHVFNTIQLRRLFGSKLRMALWAKRLKYLMD